MTTHTAPAAHADAAADLRAGDLVLAGHGYGEAPAVVIRVTRFTRRVTTLTLADNGRERVLNVAPTHVLDRAPRAGESLDGLLDYDQVREAR